MQILLHSDPHTDGSHLMAEHLKTVVTAAMERFGERITRVEAHLSDATAHAKSPAGDVHCTLEARLVGLDTIVVKDHAGNAHQAIEGATRKLKRAVDTQASVRLAKEGAGFAIDRIALTMQARIPGIDDARFQQMAAAAKLNCPVSKALASVAEITLVATLRD